MRGEEEDRKLLWLELMCALGCTQRLAVMYAVHAG